MNILTHVFRIFSIKKTKNGLLRAKRRPRKDVKKLRFFVHSGVGKKLGLTLLQNKRDVTG
jgi:hypothetical protein